MIKSLIAFTLLLLPLRICGQSEWERPNVIQDKQNTEIHDQKSRTKKTSKKPKHASNDSKEKAVTALTPDMKDYKYLVKDAVPVDTNGLVVFTKDISLPGKSAQDVYKQTYSILDSLSHGPTFVKGGIALVNKKECSIASQYTEWLTFKRTFINLDRTKFNYTIIANCTDGHLHLSLGRISYIYEEDRPTAMRIAAEKWITNKYAVNKKGTKLLPNSAKFRRMTIDRVEEIFKMIENAVL